MTDKQISFGDTSIAFADKSIRELRRMNFLFTFMGVPELTKVGSFFVKTLLRLNFPVKKLIKATIFRQFCGGETMEECQVVVRQLDKSDIRSILDYSVEGVEEERFYVENAEMIRRTILEAAKDEALSFAVFKMTGIGSASLLEKIQQGLEPLDEREQQSFERIQYRIHFLCETAFLSNVKILVDAEESWIQEVIDEMVEKMMVKFNKKSTIVYNTIQCYKTSSDATLRYLYEKSVNENFSLGIKLVRGAYMDKERARAMATNSVSPIHSTKLDTDYAYNRAMEFSIINSIALCIGTHNEESVLNALSLMDKNNVKGYSDKLVFAQLYGMGDHISYSLAKAGYNVSKYVPFGPVQSVMPYLFRRAEENKSVTGQAGRELSLIRTEMKRRKNQQ